MKLSFIVLQYNTPEETEGCINSIIKNMNNLDDYNIVIVDNGSTKEVYDYTLNKYANSTKINVIRIENNKGFSNGNNFGYEYVKEKYNPEYYYFVSNDVRLLSKGLIKELDKEYQKSKFDVLGGDIKIPSGEHVSPGGKVSQYPKNRIKVYLRKLKTFFKAYIFRQKINKESKIKGKVYGHLLQGSAVLFSKKGAENVILPFYPETYLYYEEEILAYKINKWDLVSVYLPTIKILHRESKTVDKISPSGIIRKIYKLKKMDDSLKILLKYQRRSK